MPIINKINAIGGAAIAVLTYIFGESWFLFAGYLLMNVFDWISGTIASRLNGTSNSSEGANGILKKFGYWMMIALSFGVSTLFIEMGEIIGVDLGVTSLLGWFVLATLIVNEFRSIIENFVEAGYNVPQILVKGLEVANKAIDGTLHIDKDEKKAEVEVPIENVQGKKKVVLEVKEKNKT